MATSGYAGTGTTGATNKNNDTAWTVGKGTAYTPGQGPSYTNLNDELARTESVINYRQQNNMDIGDQLTWYNKLTGSNYSFANPNGNYTALSNQANQYKQEMGDWQNKYTDMESQFNAQKRLYEELQNQMNYNKSQPNLGNAQMPQVSVDGQHNYNPSGTGTGNVLQQNNSINDALYRYLNGMWGGNF